MLPIFHQYLTHLSSKSRQSFTYLNLGTLWRIFSVYNYTFIYIFSNILWIIWNKIFNHRMKKWERVSELVFSSNNVWLNETSPPSARVAAMIFLAKQKFIERHLKHPWNFLWNFLETLLATSLNTLETSLKHLYKLGLSYAKLSTT